MSDSEQDQLLNAGGGDAIDAGEFLPDKLTGDQPEMNPAGDNTGKMSMESNEKHSDLDDTSLSYATAEEEFHSNHDNTFGDEFSNQRLLDGTQETDGNELDMDASPTGAPVTTDDLDEILQGDSNLMPAHDQPPTPTSDSAVPGGEVQPADDEMEEQDLETGGEEETTEEPAGNNELDDAEDNENIDNAGDSNLNSSHVSTELEDSLLGTEQDNMENDPDEESGDDKLGETLELAEPPEDEENYQGEDSILGNDEEEAVSDVDRGEELDEGEQGGTRDGEEYYEQEPGEDELGQERDEFEQEGDGNEQDAGELEQDGNEDVEGLEHEGDVEEPGIDEEDKLLQDEAADEEREPETTGEPVNDTADETGQNEVEPESPIASEEPETSDEPGTSEEPEAIDASGTIETPEPSEESEVREELGTREDSGEERGTSEEPETIEEPGATEPATDEDTSDKRGTSEEPIGGEGEEAEAAMETDTMENEAQPEPDVTEEAKGSAEGGQDPEPESESMEVDNQEDTAADTRGTGGVDRDVEMAEPKPEKADQGQGVSETSENDTTAQNEVTKSTAADSAFKAIETPVIPVHSVKVKQEQIESASNDPEVDTIADAGADSMGPKIIAATSVTDMEFQETPNSERDDQPAPVTRGDKTEDTAKNNSNAVPAPIKNEASEQKTSAPGPTPAAPEQKREGRKAAAKARNMIKNEVAAEKDSDDDVIAIKEEKKPAPPKPKASKIQTCIVCKKLVKCKFNIVRNGDVKHLCEDTCFKKFRSNPTMYLRQTDPAATTKNGTPPAAPANNAKATPVVSTATAVKKGTPVGPHPPVYKTCTVCQLMNVRTSKPFLNWQGLDFCGEECLGKFQGGLSSTCSYCASQINQSNRAKFCWRVGSDVKQFCSTPCYTEFVKRLKLCAFCNKDLAQVGDSFMAPVGTQGTFKDFCSQGCLQKYEEKNSRDGMGAGGSKGPKSLPVPKGNYTCAVCSKSGPVKHEFKLEGKVNRLCSDPCFSAFQYANKLTMNTCDNCNTSCYGEGGTPQYIQYEGQQKRFCSYMCVNSFRNTNKKTVPCAWCGSKKSNFDMIERVDANNKYQLFCSLNCLSLYRVNLQATSNQAVTCDQCRKFVPAQYHLTMSDASVRNFCSYSCVMTFQAQFTSTKAGGAQPPKQAQQTTPGQPSTTGTGRGRMVTRGVTQQQKTHQQAGVGVKGKATSRAQSPGQFPIISNVVSLAPQGNQQQINVKSSTGVVISGQQPGIKTTTATTTNQVVQQQIVIQPPAPKPMKNKSLLCKPFVQTKATSCRPHTQVKETQTDGKIEPDKYLVPVPVPLYVPTPLPMYTMPAPILIPVPVPIPIPIFIPTTKKSAASILKQIKEIREKIPSDPLEAELLMMAEAVAGQKDSSDSSDTDDYEPDAPNPKEPLPAITAGTTAPPEGGALGEDMLQMALRMASEMSDEPVMDLENSLEPVAVSTVPPQPATTPKPAPVTPAAVEEEDDDDYVPQAVRATRRGRGAKRPSGGRSRRPQPKRQKVEIPSEMIMRERTPSPQPPAPPPDSNFHLKYTYGVNAWKHWVLQKNVEKEQEQKAGRRGVKMFKTDVLQCTPDELNFSLVRFVKEVRKPNGEEYAVDSIYYLCLGIQQYLFESSRIDNIFTDAYYEKFTDALNEILTRYEPKLNHKSQLVCRIEEEHLWESKQLGAHSPHVLLNSLVYFNTKYFMLKTSEDHLKLSFTHIMKHWKKTASGRGSGTGANAGRCVYLRYYCPAAPGETNQKKKKEEMPVYEQTENLDNPLRCPVKLYEFYLSKCPESIKNRNDTFYLVPERSCVPDSPVWYSTAMLGVDYMAKMLNRIRLVREIQEAHLHTQPVYI